MTVQKLNGNAFSVQLISWSQPPDQPIVRDEKSANSEVLDIYCYHEIIPLNLRNIFASTTVSSTYTLAFNVVHSLLVVHSLSHSD